MAKEASIIEKAPFFIPVERAEIVKVIVVGLLVGLAVPAFGVLIANYFVEPVFCRSTDSFSICANGGTFGFNISTVLVALAGVGLLARFRVFRPFLIAVAAAATLWGLKRYLDGLQANWFEYYLWFAMLYSFAYILFYWLLRIRNFITSLVVVLVAVFLARFVLLGS